MAEQQWWLGVDFIPGHTLVRIRVAGRCFFCFLGAAFLHHARSVAFLNHILERGFSESHPGVWL
jgi:hypothetical protein